MNTRALLASLRSAPSIGLALAWLGVATASWDVVGVDIAGRTLKLTTVCFAASLATWVIGDRTTAQWSVMPKGHRVTLALFVALLTWMGVRSLFTNDLTSSMGGFAAQLIPAGIPLIVVLLHRRHASTLVLAFVYGMVATSVAGIYEVIAKTNGWYWPTSYAAKVDDTYRAAAFAFEAAYFAVPAIVAILICLTWWSRGVRQTLMVTTLVAAIVAANARIVFVQIALILVVLVAMALFMQGPQRTQLVRGMAVMAALGTVGAIAVLIASPSTVDRVTERVTSIFDPDEPTSNSPRLDQLGNVGDVIADHPVVGIGPGRLGDEFRERGLIVNDTNDADVVTNNTWTQSLVDGGIIALTLQAGLILSVAATLRRSITLRNAALFTGWISLVLAAGLTVSNFWDTEPWILLACYLGLTAGDRSDQVRAFCESASSSSVTSATNCSLNTSLE